MGSLPKKKLFQGQALLLVLLVTSVALTVVLSRVSKSVTDISITSYEEDALRAFSAAEAGVEKALLNAVPGNIPETTIDSSTNTSYEGEITAPSTGGNFIYPDKLVSGDTATFWFVSHNAQGKLSCDDGNCTTTNKIEVCWGDLNNLAPPLPAIELVVFYDDPTDNVNDAVLDPNNFSELKFVRYAYDPDSTTRRSLNGFSPANIHCAGNSNLAYSTGDIDLNRDIGTCASSGLCLIAAKVRMLYNSTGHSLAMRVQSGDLPPQGLVIDSYGKSGEAQRRVSVFQGYPEIPDPLESVIFSGGSVD